MSESFVDLLLVRLGREEEKRKVLKLLITNLDLSVTEAENAVKDSPSVIKEAVPMSEARVIQKDLYPYIDLLPRLEEDAGSDSVEDEKAVSTSGSDYDDANEDIVKDETEIDEDDMYQSNEDESETEHSTDKDEEENDVEGDDYDPVIISSVNEEIRSTNRCHICGRTPTDGERLAPCRTCSDLTCRDCFDRVAHVCNKCAADGKTIDRANEGVTGAPDAGLEFDSDEIATGSGEKSGAPRIALTVFVLLLAMAAAFYFVDPMNLFNTDHSTIVSHNNIADADTTSDAADSVESILPVDTLDVNSETVDTVSVKPDTFTVDDPHGVLSMVLPEAYVAIDDAPAVNFQLTLPSGIQADIPREESEILFHQMSVIASSIPVVLDTGVFLVYHDTTSVLVLALLHPEESGARIELMRELAKWLLQSGVDQLVLVYRETIYQDAVPMSLVREVFPDVEGILNPSQFRTFFSYRDDCWESVNGPVVDWLSNIE